jgi:hypothetical protein
MKQLIPNPYSTTNPIFKITFEWLTPLIFRGFRRPLTMDDIYDVPNSLHAHTLFESFQAEFEKRKGQKFGLLFALNKCFGLLFWLSALLKLAVDICQLAAPIFMQYIITFIMDPTRQTYEPYMLVIGLFFTLVLQSQFNNHFSHLGSVGTTGIALMSNSLLP